MRIRCLLVDDEPPALKVLTSHISKIPGMEVVAQCKNALEAVDILQEKNIDLMFLDIKMPKLNGISFLKNFSHPPKVIFVTAYRNFAVESYELDAVDYLLKPVSFERFLKAISKVKNGRAKEWGRQLEENSPNPDAFVYLKVDKGMRKIIIDEISHIESWRDYVKVFMISGERVLASHSISTMENLLSQHKFLRVHRSYIVSLSKVSEYNAASIKLNTQEIPIGRLYKQNVMAALSAQ